MSSLTAVFARVRANRIQCVDLGCASAEAEALKTEMQSRQEADWTGFRLEVTVAVAEALEMPKAHSQSSHMQHLSGKTPDNWSVARAAR